jgi:hypothetical protein
LGLYLIDSATVTSDVVIIKFGRTVKVASLVNSNFTVKTTAATPVSIPSPFRNIEVLTDFNQISRTLTLRWNKILQSNTEYSIDVQNIIDSSGFSVPTESIVFTSQMESATPSAIADYSVDVVNEILVYDKSIRPDFQTGYQILAKNPNFYIVSTDPMVGDFYLPTNYNGGRVTILFNQRPAANFLNTDYFKCQRKKIQKGPGRWENVPATISMHLWRPEVYVDFESLASATPSSYYEDNIIFIESQDVSSSTSEYFQYAYKYRIIVSGEVGA